MSNEREEIMVFKKAWQDEIDRRDEIINCDKQVIADLHNETARLDERLAYCEVEIEAYRFALEKIANLAPVLMPQQLVDRFVEVRVLALTSPFVWLDRWYCFLNGHCWYTAPWSNGSNRIRCDNCGKTERLMS